MHICVLGQGYVGLPLAVRAAEAGHTVTGYEPDRTRCAALAAGSSYVEDIGDSRLRAVLDSGAYRASSDPQDLKGFDVAVITVPTPLTDRAPDLSCVRDAGRVLAERIEPGATVVLESTTHPGTTRDVLVPLLEEGSGLVAGQDFHVGFSPERIDPGNAEWRLENTPKIVAGLTEGCLRRVKDFYDTVTEVTVPASGLEEAELAKVFENTYRHVNIALVNELSRSVHGARILALGAAYKPGTSDARQSPAVEVTDRLRAMGADVTVVDPYLPVADGSCREIPFGATTATATVTDFDAVVLLTPHAEFDLVRLATEAAYVLDTRGVMAAAPHIERL